MFRCNIATYMYMLAWKCAPSLVFQLYSLPCIDYDLFWADTGLVNMNDIQIII